MLNSEAGATYEEAFDLVVMVDLSSRTLGLFEERAGPLLTFTDTTISETEISAKRESHEPDLEWSSRFDMRINRLTRHFAAVARGGGGTGRHGPMTQTYTYKGRCEPAPEKPL